MNIKKNICLFGLFLGGTLAGLGLSVYGKPGDESDPLVSKSYVDNQISQVMGILSGDNSLMDTQYIVDQVLTQMREEAFIYQAVSAESGNLVLLGEGTEIILRSGSASCYSLVENGLVDTTSGAEIFNGQPVEKNHVLISSRNDGRGLLVQQNSYFLVRGDYDILAQ